MLPEMGGNKGKQTIAHFSYYAVGCVLPETRAQTYPKLLSKSQDRMKYIN